MARAKKIEIVRELVGSPVEEWHEWRVYEGKERIASFKSEKEAERFVVARKAKPFIRKGKAA